MKPALNAKRVEMIRTMGKTDLYWSRIWRIHPQTIRNARIGVTWPDHPATPDTAPRMGLGRRSTDDATPADPVHLRLLDEAAAQDPYQYIDKRVTASALLTLDQLRKLPRVIICCGVYFLWRRNELLYVGQSILVGQRLSQHEDAGLIPFTHHTVLKVNYDQLDTVEFDYIENLKPPFNKQVHRPGASKPPRAADESTAEHA